MRAAYFDAALSDRVVAIAEATLGQAEQTAEQVRQQREAGRMAEFDLLRSQVARDNQKPEVIRRRNARDVAYLRLKQLLDIPLDTPLQLAADLEQPVLAAPAERLAAAIAAAESGTDGRVRTAVTQAENDVSQREADVKIVRAQRLPSVAISTTYGPVAYPSVFPGFGDFRTNWTVGATAQMPLFTGGRIKAEEVSARADVTETQARLRLTRELATLDDASARLSWPMPGRHGKRRPVRCSRHAAPTRLPSSVIARACRPRSNSPTHGLLLLQSQVSRAQAARDVQLARVRLAVLPELPLDATGTSPSFGPTGAAGPAPAQQPANRTGTPARCQAGFSGDAARTLVA